MGEDHKRDKLGIGPATFKLEVSLASDNVTTRLVVHHTCTSSIDLA